VFENRVLRRIFGSKREEVTGGWRRLHEDLRNFNDPPNIKMVLKLRIMRRAEHVARTGDMRLRKPEEKRPLGRTKRRWEDNIKMDLREIRYEGADWIHLVHIRDRWQVLVNMVMNFQVP
jgi:hypothetical protein